MKALAQKFEISEDFEQISAKLHSYSDSFYSELSENQKRLFENFDLNKIVNSFLNQLNKVGNVDALLAGLRGLNLKSVLEHPNVKKLVKQLSQKTDLSNKIDLLMSSYDVKSLIKEFISAEWLKGWTIMNLLTDANIYRMIENLGRVYEIESTIDRITGLLSMANLFTSLNLDSILEKLDADDIMKQISEVDFEDIRSNLREKTSRKKPSSGNKNKDDSSKC